MEERKKALVVGMAKSGIGAAKLLCRHGYHVIINDQKAHIPGLDEALAGYQVEDRLGEDPATLLAGVDMLVPSPVIPLSTPFIRKARAEGVEIVPEIELGYRHAAADFVCITGTNGKTTCTALTGALFKAGGFHTFVLGNIGVAITEHAEQTRPGDVIVAETAALQLEGCTRFHARAAACCNITPDHLDHFGTMDNYIAAKCKVFLNQTVRDFAVLNYDDPEVRAMYTLTPATCLYFSRREEVPEGMFVRDGMLIYRRGGADLPLMRAADIRIPGGHNLENAMLSALLALAMGVSLDAVRGTLRTFPGVEHRIEFVRELHGVRYYNDSIATSPTRTIAGLRAFPHKVVLIAGGYDKHIPFAPLAPEVVEHVKTLILCGATADAIERAVVESEAYETAAERPRILRCKDLREAVDAAYFCAESGDVVTLSPACAAFDCYANFMERGRAYKEMVKKLGE